MTNRRPIIGIVPGFAGPSANREFARTTNVFYGDTNYVNSVAGAGGLPVVLTHAEDPAAIAQMADIIDGLVLTGGEDVHPTRYADAVRFPEFPTADERDRFEFALLESFLPRNKPVLAICRGHQVLNVALGGTLIQDLPAQTGSTHHFQTEPAPALWHAVELTDGSRLKRVLQGAVVPVNSYHHQAVEIVAPGMRVAARAEEGVIEAIEHETHPYLVGVQWHPERLYVNGMPHRRLFEDFVSACRNGRHDRAA